MIVRKLRSVPDLIYKIADRQVWAEACRLGFFHGSADDVRDGFIHLSTKDQIDGTAARHFRNKDNLVLIAFDAALLGSALKWEPSRDGALFPHFYAPLPVALALWSSNMELDREGIPRTQELPDG